MDAMPIRAAGQDFDPAMVGRGSRWSLLAVTSKLRKGAQASLAWDSPDDRYNQLRHLEPAYRIP